MLAQIESIAAGTDHASAAVDDRGCLFTWGRASWYDETTGLGYEPDRATGCQLTPKGVEALSEDRVVGVALGGCFTLAVTDAGAVFPFGNSYWALGHDGSTIDVLPRRVEALSEMGRRFVAVAAGVFQSFALTEEGQVYGWGEGSANGHGHDSTPQLVTALAGDSVVLVYALGCLSYAVTKRGELYTCGIRSSHNFDLGHGAAAESRFQPMRVEALRHVKVAAAGVSSCHLWVAGADGVVLGFGDPLRFGQPPGYGMEQPTPIQNLRVRTLT